MNVTIPVFVLALLKPAQKEQGAYRNTHPGLNLMSTMTGEPNSFHLAPPVAFYQHVKFANCAVPMEVVLVESGVSGKRGLTDSSNYI